MSIPKLQTFEMFTQSSDKAFLPLFDRLQIDKLFFCFFEFVSIWVTKERRDICFMANNKQVKELKPTKDTNHTPTRNSKGQFVKGVYQGNASVKYTADMPQRAIEFVRARASKGTKTRILDVAEYLKVHLSTLNRWQKEHPEFGTAIAECLEYIKQDLIDGFLTNRYHPLACKWILDVNYGMRETTQADIKQELKGQIQIIALNPLQIDEGV